MSAWQPIETAPRDGTWVQLWRGPTETGTWAPLVYGTWYEWVEGDAAWAWPDCAYDPFHEDGQEDAEREIRRGNYYDDAESFTHWQPLPEPPHE